MTPADAGASAAGRGVILHVQVLRFVAAFMVLLSHVRHELFEMPRLAGQPIPGEPVFLAGGVDIFFVISGFIMYTLAGGEYGVPGAARRFVLRRFIRVVPSYWFFTFALVLAMMMVPGQLAHATFSLPHLLASLAFLPWPDPYGTTYPVLILGWTLNFEMMFYAVFALSLLLPRRGGLALLGIVIGAVALIGIVARPRLAPWAFWCDPIVIEFLLGVAIGVARGRGLRLDARVAAVAAALSIGAMMAVHALGFSHANWTWRWVWMGLPAAVLVACAAWAPNPARPGRVLLMLVALGDASYALYLSHPFSLGVAKLAWNHLGLSGVWSFAAMSVVASLVAAVAVHKGFERPLTSLLTRWADGRLPGLGAHRRKPA